MAVKDVKPFGTIEVKDRTQTLAEKEYRRRCEQPHLAERESKEEIKHMKIITMKENRMKEIIKG